MDEMETWPTIKLHPDDAAAYLTGEIYEWFRERGIDKEAEILQEEEVSTMLAYPAFNHFSNAFQEPLDRPHVPWYCGGYRGVRIDRALIWHIRMIHESFCDNPYGLSGFFYWLILFAFLFYMFGNIMVGMVDALDTLENGKGRFWLPVFKGALAALPVVWMLTMFMFPALLANRQEQYAAYGHQIDD
jgi:hypothetical protein